MLDLYEDERHYCLVMEWMQGGELFDKILSTDEFSEADARTCISNLIDAIRYCHELGVLHRDIKPENLLLASKEMGLASVKVADFGLARKFLDGEELINNMASTTCGTPGYVAPEVLKQEKYGKECDYWSIGIVCFVILSGTMPFYDEDNFEMFEMIKNCEYDFNAPSWNLISNEAKDFVAEIMRENPIDRMNFTQMMEHPWMKIKLDPKKKLQLDTKCLEHLQSVKAEKRKSMKGEDSGLVMFDEK